MKRSPLTRALLSLVSCLVVVVCTTLLLPIIQRSKHDSGPQVPSQTEPDLGSTPVLCRPDAPPLDPCDLARRLRGLGPCPPLTPAPPIEYSQGDQEIFWVLDLDPVEILEITATLAYRSPHLYLWVEDGVQLAQDALEESARTFEEHLYPTVRRYFGSEWSPGIDNDIRLTVLNARFSGAAAYFSSRDEYLSTVVPGSNEREMIYLNVGAISPGSVYYNATLAHEFQHMVHWFADSNEDTWVNEGASELAVHLCGYDQRDRITAFAQHPDTQLTHWSSDSGEMAAHYGASFLFMAYCSERFGFPATRELVSNELNGTAGFESVLATDETGLSFQDFFADWVLANYLDERSAAAADTPYTYEGLAVRVAAEQIAASYPTQGSGTVHQYAADYLEFEPTGHDLHLQFAGQETTRLVPNQTHSGRYQWWSGRGDNSDMTLTRAFDLTGLRTASLTVWLWYDIEEGWDYAYVEASEDDGETWHILPGEHSVSSNPSSNNYGPGYTGVSGTNAASTGSIEWIQETFDLSSFVGRRVLVRFEYLTDDTITGAGLCVDDIRIPELEYSHDAETDDDGWDARGFVRCKNLLPQHYVVQLIRLSEEITVKPLFLRPDGTGELIVRGFDDHRGKAVLVVSAVTPGSTEPAHYRYEIRPLPSRAPQSTVGLAFVD